MPALDAGEHEWGLVGSQHCGGVGIKGHGDHLTGA